jgi:hypothetical protein
MKKLISILVSTMILCVMIDGVLLGEIQSSNLESGKYKENWNKEWRVYRSGVDNADGFKVNKIDVEIQNDSINARNSTGSPPNNSSVVPKQIISQYRNIRSGPYTNNCNKKFPITQPGATKIRVHFAWIKTEKWFDWVKNSAFLWDMWTGYRKNVWSRWVKGDTIVITLTSNGSVTDSGFLIDYIEYEI